MAKGSFRDKVQILKRFQRLKKKSSNTKEKFNTSQKVKLDINFRRETQYLLPCHFFKIIREIDFKK